MKPNPKNIQCRSYLYIDTNRLPSLQMIPLTLHEPKHSHPRSRIQLTERLPQNPKTLNKFKIHMGNLLSTVEFTAKILMQRSWYRVSYCKSKPSILQVDFVGKKIHSNHHGSVQERDNSSKHKENGITLQINYFMLPSLYIYYAVKMTPIKITISFRTRLHYLSISNQLQWTVPCWTWTVTANSEIPPVQTSVHI